MEKPNGNKEDIYQLILNHDVVITELTEPLESQEVSEKDQNNYFISEPFDFIFEPDHYPKESTQKQSNKFKRARIVRETDDMLEYEYKHYTYKQNALDQSLEDLDTFYLNNFDYDTHLNAMIRGVSLKRWPTVGFGFSLARQRVNNEDLVYVCDILLDSPAEYCLQLGDILVEMDDLNLKQNDSIENLEKYLEEKENVHLTVVHKSKYTRLKTENSLFNCEDIVICNYVNRIEQ